MAMSYGLSGRVFCWTERDRNDRRIAPDELPTAATKTCGLEGGCVWETSLGSFPTTGGSNSSFGRADEIRKLSGRSYSGIGAWATHPEKQRPRVILAIEGSHDSLKLSWR